MKNVVLNEIFKENGKYKIRYYNLDRKVAYTLSFGRWKKVIPIPCKEIKQRFDPIYVAALIATEIDYLKDKMNKYSVIVNSPEVTTTDKTEYAKIMKTLHYLNNYTL